MIAVQSPPNRIPKTVGIKTHVTAQHNVHHVRFVYRVKHGSFGMAVNERGGGCVGVYYPDKRVGDQRQFVERDRVVKSRWIGQALIKASPPITIPESDWQQLKATIERKTGIADFA